MNQIKMAVGTMVLIGMLQRRQMTAMTMLLLVALSTTVTSAQPTEFQGTITLARGVVDQLNMGGEVVDVDLASGGVTLRFSGLEPHRVPTGETAYLTRLEPGQFVDYGVVVADAQGAPGASIYVCEIYDQAANRVCHTPRLSPDLQHVAFGIYADGATVCQNSLGLDITDYVVVRDRGGNELARFEGFYYPDWLPDGRLLVLGSPCRGAGVWVSDLALSTLTRVDGGQVATPAANPAVSPDGSRVLFVWNLQLWMMTLDGQSELTQLTAIEKGVQSGGWSPDGTAIVMTVSGESPGLTGDPLPLQTLLLFRLGDTQAQAVPLAFYPWGPLSWY